MNLNQRSIATLKTTACIIAGAVSPLAFAPYNYFWLIFLTLAILFYFTLGNKKPVESFWLGYVFAFAFFGIGVNWLHISINLFGGVNLLGAYLATYILVAFISLYPALTVYFTKKFFNSYSNLSYIFIIPAFWSVLEWCRSWIFTGFPWLNLGYSQSDSLLSAYAPLLGVYGISFFVAVIAMAIAIIVIGNTKERLISILVTLFLFSAAFLLQDTEWSHPKNKQLDVALIQGGISQEVKWLPDQRQKTIDLYTSLTKQYWGYDIIVWPETAMPFFLDQAEPLIESLKAKAMESNSDLLIGFPYRQNGVDGYFNSLVSIGANQGIYHKQHLVPFGEYLPFNDFLGPIFHFLKIPMSNFSKGKLEQPLLKAGNEFIGVSICYEDAFGEEVIRALPEASLLVNVSNDAWFGDSLAPPQHLQMARMRSMETSRYMIRATNNGISAIIDHKGKLIEKSPQFVAHSLSASIVPYEGETPYARLGNAIIIGPLLLMLLAFYVRKIKFSQ